jgi:hypothetical protein
MNDRTDIKSRGDAAYAKDKAISSVMKVKAKSVQGVNQVEHIETVNQFVNYFQGVSFEEFIRISKESSIAESALSNFFKILRIEPIPLNDDLDHTLRQIAEHYRELTEQEKSSSQMAEVRSEIFKGWKTILMAAA